MRALVFAILPLVVSSSTAVAQDERIAFTVEIDPEPSGTQPTRTIDLDEALDRALAQNIDLALARAEEQLAREEHSVAGSALYPSLEIGLTARRLDGRVQGSFGDLQDVAYSTYAAGAGLVYRTNIAASLAEAMATRHTVEAAQLDSLDVQQRLLLRVVEAYQNLLLATIAVRIGEDVVAGSERFLRVVKARTESGLGLGADVARAEAKLATDRQQLVRAGELRIDASTRLAVLLRLDVNTTLVPADERLAPTHDSSSSFVAVADPRSRPDVRASEERALAAAGLASSAKWDIYAPELRAELGGVEIGDTPDDLEGRRQRGALILWSFSPVSYGELRQRRAEEHRARLRLEKSEDLAAAETRRAVEALEGARERIPLAGQGLGAAVDSLRLSEARFNAGTAIALEVFDAQATLAQARFNLSRAIVDYNTARARLLAALGTIDRSSFSSAP